MIATTCLVALAACTSTGPNPAPTTTSTSRTLADQSDDGVVRIGLLLPDTGPGAALGQSLLGGALLAVQQINAAGGVLGSPIETVRRDEGASPSAAVSAIDQLLDRDVDVIVGPASSRLAYSVLAHAVDEGVGVCSPTNTAIGLRAFPDRDLYFRTVPSDALQARAIGELVERSGDTMVSVLAPDDDFGVTFGAALLADLESRGLDVTGPILYGASNDDLKAAATSALDGDAQNLVLVGAGAAGASMLSAVRAQSPEVPVFVNDAMKSPTASGSLGERAGIVLAGVTGVGPDAEPTSTTFRERFAVAEPELSDDFAGYAYDCVNLIAVGALVASNDDAPAIITQLDGVTNSGNPCSSFVACAELVEQGQNIAMVGTTGDLDLDLKGDPKSGVFRTFTFDGTGSPIDGELIPVP